MKHLRYVPGLVARGAALAAALAAAGLPLVAAAQDLRGPLGAAPAAPAAPAGPRNMSESVAAVVNDEIISTYDLAQRMRLLIATSGVQPTQENLPQFQREALISLIDERLQLQELRRVEKERKINIVADEEDVDRQLGELAQQSNLRPEAFVTALRGQGINPDTLREQIRAEISWRRWIQGYYGSRLRIGEDQVTLVQQRLAAAASKPQYQVSEVFIDANRVGGMQAATAGAQQLVQQLQQGAPFPAVARQFSAAATAATGGDAGWVSPGEMPPEVDAALEQLRPGQLSAPIPVRDGVYIVYLRDKRGGAGGTLVNLKQAAVALPQGATPGDEAAARVKLEAIRTQATGCNDLEAVAGRAQGVVAGDLGEAEVSDLIPAFQEAANQLQVGQISQPVRSPAGLHVLAVCGKRAAGAAQLDREQIENRLYGQQLSMIARRAMRDLRNSATIETR
ncbi:peptidylprolyl isomerase [Phenylobacterium sp.]|uniref:peptidylprolyl isomerase n=1 Tax=Phenylobacterium sp. TaxID=1871053 RepID=UPI002F9379B0